MINLGDKQISDIKLGSTNIVSVYQGSKLVWEKDDYFIYTVDSVSNSVKIINDQLKIQHLETDEGYVYDGDGTGTSTPFTIMFKSTGEHKVKMQLFPETSVLDLFSDCPITKIQQSIFKTFPDLISVDGCFNGTKITTIPKDLFKYNPNIKDFSSCFKDCTLLTDVPEGLFDNCPNVENFASCFSNCTSLTVIPEKLFANNTKVTNFSSCFYNTPITVMPIDNDGTPIYNREDPPGKEGYAHVGLHSWCFSGANLPNDVHQAIPADWR